MEQGVDVGGTGVNIPMIAGLAITLSAVGVFAYFMLKKPAIAPETVMPMEAKSSQAQSAAVKPQKVAPAPSVGESAAAITDPAKLAAIVDKSQASPAAISYFTGLIK